MKIGVKGKCSQLYALVESVGYHADLISAGLIPRSLLRSIEYESYMYQIYCITTPTTINIAV